MPVLVPVRLSLLVCRRNRHELHGVEARNHVVRVPSFHHPCRRADDHYAVVAVDAAAAFEHQQEHLRQGPFVRRHLLVRQLHQLRPDLTSFSDGACAWSALVPIRLLYRSLLHHHYRMDDRRHARRHDDRHRHQKLLTHLWTRHRDVVGLRLRDVRDPCDDVRDAPRQDPESRRRLVRVMIAMRVMRIDVISCKYTECPGGLGV